MAFFSPGRDQRVSAKIKNILVAFVANFVWFVFIVSFLKKIIPSENGPDGGFLKPYDIYTSGAAASFFFGCILAPLWEEAAFRFAPITLAKHFGKDVMVPVIVISSVLFGWGHGSGPTSILIQGVGGVILSWLYIKNNYSYISSVTSHFLWNFNLMFFIPFVVNHIL